MTEKTEYDWIAKLDDIDQQALRDVSGEKPEALSEPRQMNFVLLNLLDLSLLSSIGDKIYERGFTVHYGEDDNQKEVHAYIIEAQKDNYIISEKTYVEDTNFFKELAHEYGLLYDGWYAVTTH